MPSTSSDISPVSVPTRVKKALEGPLQGTGGEEGQSIALTWPLADDPLLKLRAEGKEIPWIVDMGARRSIIREGEVLGVPNTSRTAKIIGVWGIPNS